MRAGSSLRGGAAPVPRESPRAGAVPPPLARFTGATTRSKGSLRPLKLYTQPRELLTPAVDSGQHDRALHRVG